MSSSSDRFHATLQAPTQVKDEAQEIQQSTGCNVGFSSVLVVHRNLAPGELPRIGEAPNP